MGQVSFSTDEEKLQKALVCLEGALQLLDDADAPADIGAHLDMAICRLRDHFSQTNQVQVPNGTAEPQI